MGYLYMGYTVSNRDGVLLVNGMEYYLPECGVSIWDGVSVYGMGC